MPKESDTLTRRPLSTAYKISRGGEEPYHGIKRGKYNIKHNTTGVYMYYKCTQSLQREMIFDQISDTLLNLKQGSQILHHHWFEQLISVYAFALESTLAHLAGDDRGGKR